MTFSKSLFMPFDTFARQTTFESTSLEMAIIVGRDVVVDTMYIRRLFSLTSSIDLIIVYALMKDPLSPQVTNWRKDNQVVSSPSPPDWRAKNEVRWNG